MQGIFGHLIGIDWGAMAVPALSVLEKIIRPLIVYAFVVAALRLAGKRELAQLNSLDFVLLLLLSNTVQNAIIGSDDSVSGGIIGALSLLGANFLLVRFLYRHPRLGALIEGRPDFLVEKGLVDEGALKKELITRSELEEAAHRQGIESLAEVERAELDQDGEVFFVAKDVGTEGARHEELVALLAGLRAEVKELRARLDSPKGA